MIDIKELKALAENYRNINGDVWYAEGSNALDSIPCFSAEAFISADNPAAVLELIAALESYQVGAKVEADAGDEARSDVHKLKAENEPLRKHAERLNWIDENYSGFGTATYFDLRLRLPCDIEDGGLIPAIDDAMSKGERP